tara:strand:+ start:175 stop:432 length:258 start_codon:yes stop_codon:yes gene_type:complete
MLARARQYLADLQPLLMSQKTFAAFSEGRAVPEPQRSEQIPETGLTSAEMQLFNHLLNLPRERPEQEFLPQTTVYEAVLDWSHSD